MTSFLRNGGIVASIVLVVMGAGAIVAGFDGRSQVRGDLARENIVGTPDSSIAGQKVDTGAEARAFADVMRRHTLEITGGQTYAEMGRFLDAKGRPTDDENAAAVQNGRPVENPARQVWVTETALATALNTAFFAERVAMFSIVTGFALLLAGIGFGVLTARLPRRRRPAATTTQRPVGAPAAV